MRLERAALPAALALGLLTGLCGIRWGLPGRERLRAFPETWRPTPEVARDLAERWRKLYEGIQRAHDEQRAEEPVTYVRGVEVIKPGWKAPPDSLLNSYRALLLQSENADEKKSFIILAQMRPWKLDFQPLYAIYAGAYIYPLGAYLKALSIVGAVTLVPDMSFYLQRPGEMGALYLAGRILMLLFHLGTLWVLFDLAKRLAGPPAGFCAAAFFALTPLVVVNEHVLKPHPAASFWALAAVRAMLLAYQGGKKKDYVLCGLFGGLAFASLYTLVFFAVSPLLAWAFRKRDKKELELALSGCALGVLVFLATNPYFVFAHGRYAWEMNYATRAAGPTLASVLDVLWNLASGAGMGGALFLLSAYGLVVSFRKDKTTRFLASAFALNAAALWLLLAKFAGGFVGFARYYYPLVGFACVLAGAAVAGLPKRWRVAVLSVALLDLGLGSFVYLVNMRRDSSEISTRAQAALWIDEKIPLGASVGLLRYPDPVHTPLFKWNRVKLLIFDKPESLDEAKSYPDYLVYDQDAAPTFNRWSRGRYEEIVLFVPYALGRWRMTSGEASAINPEIHIMRKRA